MSELIFLNKGVDIFEQLQRDFLNSSLKDWNSLQSRATYPKVDVFDFTDKVVIEAAVPGLTKNDLKIEVDNNILTIEGTKPSRKKQEDCVVLKQEIKNSTFIRSWKLSDIFDQSSIKAKVENGLLTLTINKVKVDLVTKRTISLE